MATLLYPLYKESMLDQDPAVDIDTDTIKVALVSDDDYTYSAAHQYKSSVTSYAGTTDQTLGSKTVTAGLFDAADAVFSAVDQSGTKKVDALVIYKDTGNPATSPLIEYIDLASPLTPNGGDITVQWNASGIFQV